MGERQTFAILFLTMVFMLRAAHVAADEPISMSAEEFSRLSDSEQKALLVRAFEGRLEHSRNLFCEVRRESKWFKNADGERGDLIATGLDRRYVIWRCGESYRMDTTTTLKDAPDDATVTKHGYDAESRTAGSTSERSTQKRKFGRIDRNDAPAIDDNPLFFWLDGTYPHAEDYLFRDLLGWRKAFKIETLPAEDRVQLTIPFKPWWAERAEGERVFILNPRKGFLPERGTSRFGDAPPGRGQHPLWRMERFVVEESQEVGGIWMPTRLVSEVAASPAPDQILECTVDISELKHGEVRSEDLFVPFTDGMEVVDAIGRVAYRTDETGAPSGPLTPVHDGLPR